MQQFSPQTFYVTQPYFYVSENYSRVKQELHWTKLCLDGSQTVFGYDHTQVSEVYIFRNKHLIIISLLTRHFMLLSFGKYYIQVFKVFMYFFFLLFLFQFVCIDITNCFFLYYFYRFKLSVNPDNYVPIEDMIPELILRAKNGIKVNIAPRV